MKPFTFHNFSPKYIAANICTPHLILVVHILPVVTVILLYNNFFMVVIAQLIIIPDPFYLKDF